MGSGADGAIARVGTEPYAVEWIADGRRLTGAPIAYDRVPIDGDERNAERNAFMSRGRGTMRMVDPPRERAGRDPELVRRIPDDVFPRFKPPFTDTRVLVSPAGEVWIPRVGAWDAEWTIVDVVGRDGNLRRQVRLPASMRVVGFGRATVYVAVKDGFDLQRLERIPLNLRPEPPT